MKLKKLRIILFISLLIISLTGVLALTLTSTQKNAINLCKKECSIDKKDEIKFCAQNYKTSISSCNLLVGYYEKRECKKEASLDRKSCIKESNLVYTQCRSDCPLKALNPDAKCNYNDEVFNASQLFQKQCQKCRCNFDGNIKCEDIPNCGFSNFTIIEEKCIESNGLYQKLCNGPYFGQKCSSINFCQCSGINNYSCPNNTFCLHNFTIPDIPMIIPKWTDTSGNLLGDIGICANYPHIENCGNGICENIVGKNKIAENIFTCPSDCS